MKIKSWAKAGVEIAERMNNWALGVSAFAFLLALGLTVFEVVSRYFFKTPTKFNVEIGGYLLLMSTILVGGQTWIAGRHINVDVFSVNFNQKLKRALSFFYSFLALICGGFFVWQSINMTIAAYHDHWRSFILSVPMWVPIALVPLGWLLLCLAALARIYRIATNWQDTSTTRRVD